MKVAIDTKLMRQYGRCGINPGTWSGWMKRKGADAHCILDWCAASGADFRDIIVEDNRPKKRLEYRVDIVNWMDGRGMTRQELAKAMKVTVPCVHYWIKRGRMSAKNRYKLEDLDGRKNSAD
jgi:hypothetical protein